MSEDARPAAGFEPLAELANQLYASALRSLATGAASGEPMREVQALIHHWADGLKGQLATLVPGTAPESLLTPFVQALTAVSGLPAPRLPLTEAHAALRPVAQNIERTWGGLADAFGLAPLRELQQASAGLAAASLERRQAQADYLAVVTTALGRGAEAMAARLDDMARRGESVETLLGLLRLWARATDEAMHSAMQSTEALQASAGLVRASTRVKRAEQQVVALISEALNMPTRAEVDEAYREIQDLKRELRRWRKGEGALRDARREVTP